MAAAKTTISRLQHASPSFKDDFGWYYAWSAQYAAGEPLWTSTAASGYVRPGIVRPPFCNYTPFFIKATGWLVYFDWNTAHALWNCVQIVCVVLATVLWTRSFEPPLEFSTTLVATSLVLFSQSFRFVLLRGGLISPFILLALTASWITSRRQRPGAAGFCLAAATLLKLYPGIVGVYFAFRRKWHELGWAIAFFGLGIIATGVKNWSNFTRFSLAFSGHAIENFGREVAVKYRANLLELISLKARII
jgi:hypothetical protein